MNNIKTPTPKYGFNLEIINNETKDDVQNGFMTDDLDVIVKELEQIIKDLQLLKKEDLF